jgi:hypothetical protein
MYLEAVRRQRRSSRYDHGVILSYFMDYNFVDGGARCFPLYERQSGSMFEVKKANFRDELLVLLSDVYGSYPQLAEDLFYHIAAVLNTPKYREENTGSVEIGVDRETTILCPGVQNVVMKMHCPLFFYFRGGCCVPGTRSV